jgi:amino acid adenylation domain-containing protein/non-ribosomal peptide synthase protein (TIGR01720 family)/FkbM family methyltransferase
MAIENHIPFLELSSALSDVAASAVDDGRRRALRCESFPADANAQVCVAAWHGVLHWLRYNDEPIITCLLNARVRKSWPIVTETSAATSLGQVLAQVRNQWMHEENGWLDLDDSAHAGLLDQLRCHAMRLHDDRDAEGLRAEFELVATQSGWEVECAASRFTEAYQRRVMDLWRQTIVRMLESPDALLSAQTYGGGGVCGPLVQVSGNLVERFVEQVTRHPLKVAVVDSKESHTYAALNHISSSWAYSLRAAGVTAGQCVGVVFERNWKMVAAQLAVLKLGAVFVPMDAGQPKSRLQAMADDTTMSVALTEEACMRLLTAALPGVKCLSADDLSVSSTPLHEFLGKGISTEDLAYVVFTSGSTGRPKGVKVSHGNLLNFVLHLSSYAGDDDVVLQFAPSTFDASVAEIHIGVLNGGKLVILTSELIENPDRLQSYMTEQRVTFAAFPPQYARHLSPSHLPHLKTLITAGSAPDHELIGRWQPHLNYMNGYGPTETTVVSTVWRASRVPDIHEPIVIGSPIANTEVRVVNRFNRALPRGVIGELLIGGAGVAQGYIKRQELTRERFIEADRTRWYRSGDLSCFNDADELIFAGRVDNQIKLRGHRLEPGEVETALLCIPGIKQAAVLAVDIEAASQLVAFCAGERQPEEALRERLRQLVPAWAIPNRIVWLDSLPLNVNGKTDYKQLRRNGQQFDEPQREQDCADELEAQVAEIWGSVLQRTHVSRDDHFIHLGGDSLTALVVISALKRLKYTISSSQLLAHPRLADFAALLRASGCSAPRDYAAYEGVAPPSPIQGWFFDLRLQRPGAFCQTLIFETAEKLDADRLQRALAKLTRHHDQLRARFVREQTKSATQEGWHQEVLRELTALPAITLINVQDAQLEQASERCRLALADELHVEQAPLFRMALLITPTRSRVVWVIHHLIVDTVSHGIALEDLRQLYKRDGEDIEQVLPGKSISYLSWSQRLSSDCQEQGLSDLSRWRPMLREIAQAQQLPITRNAVVAESLSIVAARLSRSDTARLIEGAAACYHQSPEEIVLAATYLALSRTFSMRRIAIDVEWHGRDEKLAGAQGLDRTIGWFTSVHPLCLTVPERLELGSWLTDLKEARARIGNHGRDLYALRYLSRDPQIRAELDAYRAPQVLFNFSGIMQRRQGSWNTVPAVAIELGAGNASPYALSVESEIRDGELIISFYHPSAAWPEACANDLARAMTQALEELIAHCCEPSHARWTPSDFPLAALTRAELDALPLSVQAVHPLTDMQQTMFRHKETYQVVMCYRMPRRFDESRWRAAVADWISRHDCLRTYIQDWSGEHVDQVILDKVEPPVTVHRAAPGDAAALAKDLLEKVRRSPVQLTVAPLFDMHTIDDDSNEFRFVLAIHHIIHDGWSIELLLSDLVQTYRYYCGETDRRPAAPLAHLADLVAEQSRLRASAEWRAYWAGLPWQPNACLLPESVRFHTKPLGDAEPQSPSAQRPNTRLYLGALDQNLASAVRACAHSRGVTVNSLWLTGYVCLLRFLGGRPQVRCGVIQSGRMERVPNVETITGCCVNTLPLVLNIGPAHTLSQILADVNSQLERMSAGAAFPLSEIHNLVRPRIEEELFRSLFNVESRHYGARRQDERAVLECGYESTNYSFVFGLIERADCNYGVRIGYDASCYDIPSVERWFSIYERCMRLLIESAETPWNRLQMLPESLLRKIVSEWNCTQRPYPHDRCVAELFHEQTVRVPEHPALLYQQQQLSYRELDGRSDELARLLQVKGVRPETVVGVVAERSFEAVIAMLAILKAGGAYLPLDPKYPAARIRHMVRDAGCRIAIFQHRALASVLPPDITVEPIYLDEPIKRAALPATLSKAGHHSRQLAYVMYTSGSTGNAKGVMIEQRSIVRLVKGTSDIAFASQDRIPLSSALAFDATTFELWSALLNGLTLAIVDEHTLLEPERLAAEIRDKRIATLWLTAPLFNQLVQEKPEMFAGVKQLMLGGDALSPAHVRIARQANPGLQIINGYGPTENTSFSTFHFLGDADFHPDVTRIPIGRPLTNSTAYVCNEEGQLLPPGVSGELVVGGAGVARGYLNQPELTAQKFIRDPFSAEPGAQLYRTGDLACWREDGLIDFLGRIDHQVKIRGFRVELGEIENEISSHEDVKQALVLKKKQEGREQLIAYVVPKQASAKDEETRSALVHSIIAQLQAGLPDYMMPAAFVMLDVIPRNANGKIDRLRLPEPDVSAYTHSAFVEPANDRERTLWTIWKEVLGVDTFGVMDSFYSIGGDSILAIQVAARAAKQSITITTRQLIEAQTIRNLARLFEETSAVAKSKPAARAERTDAAVTGEQRLLPIQLTFLQNDGIELNHYNQYAWIDLPADISSEKLHAALSAIIARHDVLRLRFRETPSGWVAHYRPEAPTELIEEEDLSEIPPEWRCAFIANVAAEAQTSLDIKQGRLCKWLRIKSDARPRLLWVMHHLIVDAVSWRVLLSDLEALLAGRALAPKSSSYQEWAATLHEYAFSDELDSERPYWLRQLASPTARVKLGDDAKECLEESTQYVEGALSTQDTSRLLHQANRYYNTQTQQLLIAALTRTLGEWLQSDDMRIDIEGHGREERGGLDLSQTVGWFTTLYPVHFADVRTDLGRHIRRTKEHLDIVPNNGIGYGILSFLTQDEELYAARENLHFSEADVLFNYLGQFNATERGGSSVSPRRRRTHALRINASVNAGALSLSFDYSKQQLEQPVVAALVEQYLRTLREIIEHCTDSTAEHVSSPFPLAGLSHAELRALRSKYSAICDIYPCTGMQQGLLLWSERDPGSGVYLTQLRFDLDGVDPERLHRSWQALMKRHAILRTAFVDAGQSCLLQLVLAEAPLPWREVDGRAFADSKELEDLLSHERVRPLNVSAAPLMRLLLVRLMNGHYRLAWTHHHALLDGWSMALLVRELFDIYGALGRGNFVASAVTGAPVYKDYIAWLQRQDRGAAARYWRTYLTGVDATPLAGLPVLTEREQTLGSADPRSRHEQKGQTIELAADVTALLTQLARSNGVSLSTVLLAAWGLLLSKYGSTQEVLFGYASSGRPTSLPGIESMVGLFINSLPLRLNIDGDSTLAAWLKDIQRQQLDHEEKGFVELAEIQRLVGVRSGQALFDSLVVIENYPLDRSLIASMSADGLRITDVQGVEQNSFALNFVAYPAERLTLKLAYQTRLFDDETISTMLRRLVRLLSGFGKSGERKIAQLSMLTSEEQTRAIRTWNDTRTGYPDDHCLPDLFAAQATGSAQATAIVSGEECWTYRKLAHRVQAISAWLSRQGVVPGDKVALSLSKEPDLIASMIAILHAGAAYVPIALDCPSERRAFIAADAGIKWTLAKKAFADQVDTPNVRALFLDKAPGRAKARPSQAEGSHATAYIIYTSGTTGKPKGVAITHRNLINFCSWCTDIGLFGPGDAMTQFAPYTFDASAGEIFAGLLAGAELHLLAEAVIQDPRALERYLGDHHIRFAAFPPPYLQQLQPARVPQDITILTAGSAPTRDLVERWGGHCRYINGYGPTETTILSSIWKYDPSELDADRTLSIGKPISNTVIYVVDPVGQLCAPGLVGEILIGGDGVAQGYVNRPELTERQFIRDPWNPGGCLYRTGDLGRWLPDGRIEFIGRRDRQVKVRGFRIELSEIESRLREHPAVKDAAVTVRGTDADAQILAWVVLRNDRAELETLRSFLRQTLPPYMLPQAIVPLDLLPLTAHGKVDERALPQLANGDDVEHVDAVELERALTGTELVQAAVVLQQRSEQASHGGKLVSYCVLNQEAVPAASRIVRMRAQQRLTGDELMQMPNGMAVCVINQREALSIYQEIFVNHSYERYGIHLAEGAVVFDVGANIGLFATSITTRFASVSVYSFEPIPDIFRVLELNAEIYGGDRNIVHCQGLSNAVGSAEFDYYPHSTAFSGVAKNDAVPRAILKRSLRNSSGASELQEQDVEEFLNKQLETRSVTVSLTTLSEQIRHYDIEHIDLLKIDVERSERQVLRGIAERDWPKIRQIAMEVLDEDGALAEIKGLLSQQGFEVYIDEEEELQGTGLYNLFAVRLASDKANYVIHRDDRRWASPEKVVELIQASLSRELLDHLLPNGLTLLPELLLRPDGKVDRERLLGMHALNHDVLVDQSCVARRTESENRLKGVWASVLKLRPEQISAQANFFDLGGHSLLAMRVIARVREEWGVEIAMSDLFARPVLADQALALQDAARSALPPITAVARDMPLPLSFAQQRLWFMAQIDGGSEAYHLPGALRLTGALNRVALRRALDRIVARHEILRTNFQLIDGEPIQLIGGSDSGFALVEHDLRAVVNVQDTLQAMLHEEATTSFDFENGPLVRGRLLTLNEHDHVLLVTVHHIVMDGWSMGVVIRELGTLYRAYCADQPDPMPPLAIQYADYALWQRRWLAGEVLREQCEYWQRVLAAAPPLLELPTDRPRPVQQQFAGATVDVQFDEKLTAGLKALSQRHGTTVFTALLAGWAVVLSRLSGQQDIVIGAPVANRTQVEVEPLIGFFVNAIALRMDLSGAPTVSELFRRAKAQALGAQQHQHVPFEQVVEIVSPPRSLAYSAIFQVSLNWQNVEIGALDLGSLQVAPIPSPQVVSKFDMKLNLGEVGACIAGNAEFATALFDRQTIERHIDYLRRVLQAMVDSADESIDRLPLIGDAERHQVLTAFNATRTDYSRKQCIHELFEAQAASQPGAIAVEYGSQQLSYRELNRRANRLAHLLIAQGVRPDDRVAICVDRSLEMVVGILGILKAGGAYVPLDPSYPPERLAYLIKDSSSIALLFQRTAPGNVARLEQETSRALPLIAMDELDGVAADGPDHNPDPRQLGLTSRNLAYVIYTSGSTGQPKGVMVEHTSAVNFWEVLGRTTHRECRRGSRVALNATYTFDMSLKGLLQLLSGHCVVLIPQTIRGDGKAMLQFLEDKRIDAFDCTPSQLEPLLRAGLIDRCTHPPVSVLLGGEPISAAMWRTLKDSRSIHFFNMYGPTECTVDASIGSIRESVGGPTIGKPIANTQIYVLDAHLQPAPIGVVGEMYLGGVQVARGYLNRPELTAERFLKDPFAGEPDARMYKTGDLARYLRDGTLEYVGRADFQVKIRGFRIELGEIESCLRRCPGVREAIVVARDRDQGDKQIVAYVTQDSAVTAEDLRARLRAELPDYMVPAAIVALQELPLNPNGKIDREALPEPNLTAFRTTCFEAPREGTEALLAGLWREILNVEHVGRNDSFFDLGGNSILLIRWLSELREHRMMLNVTEAYRLKTLAACSATIDASLQAPLVWLQSCGWTHRWVTVGESERGVTVLLLDSRGQSWKRDLQHLLARVADTKCPDFVRVCDDIEAFAQELQAQGIALLASSEDPLESLDSQLEAYRRSVSSAEPEESFPLSPIQENFLLRNERDGVHCIPVSGWYAAAELQSAFHRLAAEQDLLRSVLDAPNRSWHLLAPEKAGAAALPVIDLKMGDPLLLKERARRVAERLHAERDDLPLPYAAAWLSASDTQHYLLLVMDHLIWDGASADAFRQRLSELLRGEAQPLQNTYRDYAREMLRAPEAPALELLNRTFEHRALDVVIASTRRVLETRAHLPLQMLQFSAPLNGSVSPANEAFRLFRYCVSQITGLDQFAMVFTHHARRLGARAYSDHVGLFLDKLPFAVSADSELTDFVESAARLHEQGHTYLGLEHAARHVRAPLLPPLDYEILFNFRAYGPSEHVQRASLVDAPDIQHRLREHRGVLFEAYVDSDQLRVGCAFRGESVQIDGLSAGRD